VLCCLLVNGWATVQCCYEDTSSCSKRLVVLHLQPNLASPFSTRCSLCLLSVCFQSSPRLDLHLPYWNGRPFVHPFASHPVCLPAGGEWD